eukprot:scaffold33562_cov125-Skeletonema_dohrnii-CCMP3373.AAC.4
MSTLPSLNVDILTGAIDCSKCTDDVACILDLFHPLSLASLAYLAALLSLRSQLLFHPKENLSPPRSSGGHSLRSLRFCVCLKIGVP